MIKELCWDLASSSAATTVQGVEQPGQLNLIMDQGLTSDKINSVSAYAHAILLCMVQQILYSFPGCC